MHTCTSPLRHPTAPAAAVLRDISEGTSYQTVRLVFRHYAHIPPSSCTSERLRTSSSLSSAFAPRMHSSLSFGSHPCAFPLSANAACMISLVRVTRRADPHPLLIHTFVLHPVLFTFRSRYFSAIGHAPIFSLGSPQPPKFTLHYQTVLLTHTPHRKLPCTAGRRILRGARPLCRRITQTSDTAPPIQLGKRQLPSGLLSFHSPLLRESSLVSSPPSTDMLKSKGFPCSNSTIQTPHTKCASRAPSRPSSTHMPMPPVWMST